MAHLPSVCMNELTFMTNRAKKSTTNENTVGLN